MTTETEENSGQGGAANLSDRADRADHADLAKNVDRLGFPPETARSIALWLTGPRYAGERAALTSLVRTALGTDADADAARAELAEAFAGPLPIGTGGRRGTVGPGTNRFNTVVVRETAQGLADAMRALGDAPKVAILHDTRRDSATFAQVAAEQLAANDIEVVRLSEARPTPELSFLVRTLGCGAGIVLSASHNPPSDNGIKLYGPDGAQVLGARDRALMEAIVAAGERDSLPEASAEQRARIRVLDADAGAAEADAPYQAYVGAQGVAAPPANTGFRAVFTPLHGVGHTSVVPVLRARGIDVEPVPEQCDPDGGRFSTVTSANPEKPESMDMAVALAKRLGAQIVLATDPDADRLGACVRDPGGDFVPIDGNRLGVLMLDHVLRHVQVPDRGWVLTTLVTTPLLASLVRARGEGLEIVDDLLVGFKHHAGMMRENEGRPLVFGCEESHGFMRGNGVRDKDGAIAALLLAECAALAHAEGRTLLDELDRIWRDHGYHREKTANLWVTGLAGKRAIAAAMSRWREQPPTSIGGLAVVGFEDRSRPRATGSETRDLPGNVLCFELEGGGQACRLVLRPSGTEPKLKVYALARSAAGLDDTGLASAKRDTDALIERVLGDAEGQVRALMAAAG